MLGLLDFQVIFLVLRVDVVVKVESNYCPIVIGACQYDLFFVAIENIDVGQQEPISRALTVHN